MGTLYENIKSLCDENGIRPGKMCVEAKVSKGLITDLKMGRKKTVQIATAKKIADYFGVSVDRVMGVEKKPYIQEDIGPNKQKILDLIDDLSEAEVTLLLERIQKIKESRV